MKQLSYSIMLVVSSTLLANLSLADSGEKGVLYWQEKNDSVEMRVYLPDEKTSLVMATFNSIPERLFFSSDWSKFFYVSGKHLYEMQWKPGAKPVRYLIYPEDWPGIENSVNWRDKTTNKWRFAYTDRLLSKCPVVTKGDVKYLKYRKELVVINNGYYPSQDIKYALEILNIREYDPKTGWRTIAYVSTTCNAHSDPCFDALGSHRQLDSLISDKSMGINMLADNTKLTPFKTVGKGEMYTEIYKTNPDTNMFIKVNLSDSGQFYPPLSMVKKDANKEIVLISDENGNVWPYRYLGMQQYKHYLLVVETTAAINGQLFDLNTGKQIFSHPEKSPSFWVRLPQERQGSDLSK